MSDFGDYRTDYGLESCPVCGEMLCGGDCHTDAKGRRMNPPRPLPPLMPTKDEIRRRHWEAIDEGDIEGRQDSPFDAWEWLEEREHG